MGSHGILISVDEELLAKELAKKLETLGYQIAGQAFSAQEAYRMVDERQPSLILMDIDLEKDTGGIDAAVQIRTKFDGPLVYLIEHAEMDVIERAKHTKPYGYVSKPVSIVQLSSTVETALFNHKSDQKIRESQTQKLRAEDRKSVV